MSELEGMAIPKMRQREENGGEKEQGIIELWDNIKRPNTCAIGVLGEKKERAESTLKK